MDNRKTDSPAVKGYVVQAKMDDGQHKVANADTLDFAIELAKAAYIVGGATDVAVTIILRDPRAVAEEMDADGTADAGTADAGAANVVDMALAKARRESKPH